MERRIAIIGAGNVARHIAPVLNGVVQVYSRNADNARLLAKRVGGRCRAVSDLSRLTKADIYVVMVKDDAIRSVLEQVEPRLHKALWMHTSGSVGIDVFPDGFERCGVLYPLQTFSKTAELDASKIPFFIEGNRPEVTDEIRRLAMEISPMVNVADSALRGRLHIAAVFACNFSNYMYTLSEEALAPLGLDLKVMRPLLEETLRKAADGGAARSQTGPAARGDTDIIVRHEEALCGEALAVYRLLSENIMKRYNK